MAVVEQARVGAQAPGVDHLAGHIDQVGGAATPNKV